MANAVALRDHVMRTASLNTSDTTEQALVLAWLNDAYVRAIAKTGMNSAAVDLPFTTTRDTIEAGEYAPATSVGQGGVSVDAVYRTAEGGAAGHRLTRIGMSDLIHRRSTLTVTGANGPTHFAVRGNGDIEVWPEIVGHDMTVERTILPLQLATTVLLSSQEDNPGSLPVQFHYEVLGNFALSKAFEYRGIFEKAQYFRALAENGIEEMVEYLNEQGGVNGPRVKVVRPGMTGVAQPGEIR